VVRTHLPEAIAGPDVIDPVGERASNLSVREVVDVDALGGALRLTLPAAVGLVAHHELLFLRVDGDDRLTCAKARRRLRVDVTELCVTVGVLGTFDGDGRRLEAVAHLVEQLVDGPRRDLVTLVGQGLGQLASGRKRPAQRRHGIAPGVGADQLVEARE